MTLDDRIARWRAGDPGDDVHVVPCWPDRWGVDYRGRLLSVHHTQRRAVEVGKRLAKRLGVDLVTHVSDGRIGSKDTYGQEGPGRDTEH